MPDGLLGLATALVGIPSVSHHEQVIADAVQAALELCPWLDVHRVGDNVVARTDLGRRRRVLLAGHLDTVPPAGGNDEPRLEGSTLHGLGAADMKGGLAVFLHLAGRLDTPAHDLTWCFYAAEEVAREHSGLHQLWAERPELLEADAAVLGEPTAGRVEAGCQGTLRIRIRLAGARAHTARPQAGRNAVHRLGPLLDAVAAYDVRRPVLDGCEYAEQLQAVSVEGGVAGNVVPDEAILVLNHRFAPDRTVAEAESWLRELLAPHLEAGDHWELVEAAPGAPPVPRRPGARRPGDRHRGASPGQVGLDGRRLLLGPRGPGGQLRPGRSAPGPHAGRARERGRAGRGGPGARVAPRLSRRGRPVDRVRRASRAGSGSATRSVGSTP